MENDTGMMRMHRLDLETSRKVYQKLRKRIEPKLCYNNVFNMVSAYQGEFMDGRWKVSYGYVRTLPNVYCRHCFVLDTESELIIDPTVLSTGNPTEERDYYIMRAFDSLGDYISAIDKEHNLPALEHYLKDEDINACKLAFENGVLFIG